MSNKLIQTLEILQKQPSIRLGEICEKTNHQALILISLISVLPFLQPIPLPGLSTLLGMVIFFQGFGLCFKGEPILAEKMRNLEIDQKKFSLILEAAKKLLWITQKCSLYPSNLTEKKGFKKISGVFLMIAALFLSLPLPIPFSNFIPAVCIFLICIAHLENDLFLLISGYLMGWLVIGISFFSIAFLKELGFVLIK